MSSGYKLEFAFVVYILLGSVLAMIIGEIVFVPMAFAVIGYPVYRVVRYARKHPDQNKLRP